MWGRRRRRKGRRRGGWRIDSILGRKTNSQVFCVFPDSVESQGFELTISVHANLTNHTMYCNI